MKLNVSYTDSLPRPGLPSLALLQIIIVSPLLVHSSGPTIHRGAKGKWILSWVLSLGTCPTRSLGRGNLERPSVRLFKGTD